MDFKKTLQPLTLEWLAAVPKLFCARSKFEFGEHLATKFVFNISNLHFSHVPTLQTDTDNQ